MSEKSNIILHKTASKNNTNNNHNHPRAKTLTVMESSSIFVSLGEASSDSYYNDHKICSFQNGFALLFAAFNALLNFFVLAIIHEVAPRNETLPDLSFYILPEAPWGLAIAEYIISIEAFLVFTLIFFHRSRVILFRRLCIIMGIIYFFRAICMSATQVPIIKTPKSELYCAPMMDAAQKASWGSYLAEIFRRVYGMMWGAGLTITNRHTYCGDYIFSGHTVTLTFFYMFLREYLLPKMTHRSIFWLLFHICLFLGSVSGVILILVARGHYLIDVIIAYFVTTTTFHIYHTLVYNKCLRTKHHKNYIARFWWFGLLKYVEYDHFICSNLSSRSNGICPRCDTVTTEVPRKFSWPFSWPNPNDRRSRSLQRLLSQA